MSFIGCKKEQLEEKKTQVESIDQITEESENQGGEIDEKEEDGKADGAENDIKKEDEIFRKLTNGVLRGEKEISVGEFLISTEKADSIYKQFLINNPLLFHLSIMGNMGYSTSHIISFNTQRIQQQRIRKTITLTNSFLTQEST